VKPERFYSIAQAHDSFLPGLSAREIRRLCERGDIAAAKHGTVWLIPESSIATFQERIKAQRGVPSSKDRITRRHLGSRNVSALTATGRRASFQSEGVGNVRHDA